MQAKGLFLNYKKNRRLVKDAPIYSEHTFNNSADIAAVMGDCMCQFDREVVCVVNLRSDLKPINVHFATKMKRWQSTDMSPKEPLMHTTGHLSRISSVLSVRL